MKTRRTLPRKQSGVAVIMALLLTTLAITIVASLFWQQQVQVRLIENQRLQLQKQWILRGALDWASLILREDAKYSSVDTLDEPWSVPLADTRLDQYVENGNAESDLADTHLSGSISDAQARFNLNNLVVNGAVDPAATANYAKLLTLLNLDASLAELTASHLAKIAAANLASNVPPAASAPVATSAVSAPPSKNMNDTQLDDLLSIAEYTPAQVQRLKPFVIFLPTSTPVNINTAPAELIAAMVGNLSLADAKTLLVSRQSASFRDLADFANRLPNQAYNPASLSVNSSYFLINGNVHMNRARLDMQALLQRNGATTRLLWIREF